MSFQATTSNYRLVAGALRNDGAPNYWQAITVSSHAPIAIDSVATSSNAITITHGSIAATAVCAFIATPDETLAAAGFTVGASVGLGMTVLTLTRKHDLADYIYFNGSSWMRALGSASPFTITGFAAGNLTVSHPSVGATEPYLISMSARQGGYLPQIGSNGISDTITTIEFYDYAGSRINTPDPNMKLFLTRACATPVPVDPRAVDTTASPSSNLWVLGAFEVA